MKRVLIIQVAALGWDLWQKCRSMMPSLSSLAEPPKRLRPVFPALTAPVQATVTTGRAPAHHGIVANGFFSREFLKAFFWEQSARLVDGEKIWHRLKKAQPDATTAMLFWQNSIGSGNDFVLSPAPIHKHGGGIIDACYSKPAGLYDELVERIGPFKLRWYWGPFTSAKASQWIARATAHMLRAHSPTLVMTYLPHLDYCLQKHGPGGKRVSGEIQLLDSMLAEVLEAAGEREYEVCLFSDYAIVPVASAAMPNQLLAGANLFASRTIKGRSYPNFAESRAFALCDHQVAHIYCPSGHDPGLIRDICDVLSAEERVARVYSGDELSELGIAHRRCGEVVAVARDDAWFAYPWWKEGAEAPDFASHVDIHNKPGFDPLELFFDPWHMGISLDTRKVRGSHGKVADDGSGDAILTSSGGIAGSLADAGAMTDLPLGVLDYLTGT